MVVIVLTAGLWISVNRLAFQLGEDELAVMAYVRDHSAPGEVYLLPVRLQKLAKTTRGSLSSDFKPLADKKQSSQVIAVDLQRFRLHAGVPIFVDFKSIPYKDTDVIEWHQRLLLAESLQARLAGDALAELRRLGVTHVVRPSGSQTLGEGVEKVYEDEFYHVYRLR